MWIAPINYQVMYRHRATPASPIAGSFLGGFRTPAPERADTLRWAGTRNPAQSLTGERPIPAYCLSHGACAPDSGHSRDRNRAARSDPKPSLVPLNGFER